VYEWFHVTHRALAQAKNHAPPATFAILDGMRGHLATLAMLAFSCAAASPAHADEFHLKDGSKIIGTIVGFENNAFKVQTSYGFAIVDKDKIASIVPSVANVPTDRKDSTKDAKPSEDKKPSAEKKDAEEKKAVAAPANAPSGGTAKGAPPAPAPAGTRKSEPATPASAPNPSAAPKTSASPMLAAPIGPVPPSAPSPAPPALPATGQPMTPAPVVIPIRESVEGNLYTNQTYGFRLYKPPSWQVLADARKELPFAVVALGDIDDTVVLIIAREPLQGSVEKHAAATEDRLRENYENYRTTGETPLVVAGVSVKARDYRGMIDGHDWSGMVVTLARGKEVFTIVGTTAAESDLVQIQENVIRRAISSLEFTSPK
jgi:hypothetical protein